jgi:glycine betaine/proline transport system ATP-binding protein
MSNQYKIEMRGVTKIFGPSPEMVLQKLQAGESKDQLQADTGHVIGLNNVDLKVAPGKLHVVMGLSGSGKSTLIRHVNRLIDPTAGEIFVDGQNVLDMSLEELRTFRRTKIAMVFQKFGLLPHRSVIDNVAYGLEIRGIEKKERLEIAAQWVSTVGLDGYEKSRPHQLSGGQQQRVGLARALAMDVDILLMDEAFSALDPLIRSGMQDELLALQKELNKTILFITHDFDEALKIGDQVTVLQDGAVVQSGRPEEVVLNPANAHVQEFVQDVNRARAIHVHTIMEQGVFTDCEASVSESARCEDVLPLFAEYDWVGVTNAKDEIVGKVTAKQVIKALARHSGVTG